MPAIAVESALGASKRPRGIHTTWKPINTLGLAQTIGGFLLVILAASIVGGEYGMGTYRAALAEGIWRWRYLTAKLALLLVYTTVALLVVMGLSAITSARTSSRR